MPFYYNVNWRLNVTNVFKQENSGEFILMEFLVNLQTFQLNASFKSPASHEVVAEFAAQCKLWWSSWYN